VWTGRPALGGTALATGIATGIEINVAPSQAP